MVLPLLDPRVNFSLSLYPLAYSSPMTVKIRTHTKFYFQVGHSNLGTHLIDTVTYFLQAVWFQKYTDYRLQMNLRFF